MFAYLFDFKTKLWNFLNDWRIRIDEKMEEQLKREKENYSIEKKP